MAISDAGRMRPVAGALAAGAMNYFQKPVDNEELFMAIRHALEEDAESEPMI